MKITADEFLRRYAEGERDFFGIKLTNTDLSRQIITGAILGEGDLSGTDFSANVRGCNFSGSQLVGCRFDRADLTQVCFSDADLRNASFVGAKLMRADLSEANLNGADPGEYNFEYAVQTLEKWEDISYGAFEPKNILDVGEYMVGLTIDGKKYQINPWEDPFELAPQLNPLIAYTGYQFEVWHLDAALVFALTVDEKYRLESERGLSFHQW